jgi:membrane protease YdiL (CAAX protease family)
MSNASDPLAAGAPPPSPPRPWGYFTTFGWVVIANVVGSVVAMAALYSWNPDAFPADLDFAGSMKDARFVSATTIIANVVQVVLIVWAARKAPWTVKEYLALTWPSRQEVTVALIAFFIMLPALDAMAYLAGQPIIPAFMTDVYRDARASGTLLLLWLAIVVAAPVAEEIIFRGFIFRSWVRAGRHALLGIVVLSAFFAVIHFQYNWFGVFQVFLIGLLLTWIRWRSGSTLLPMALHVIANGYAMLQVIAYFRWFSGEVAL